MNKFQLIGQEQTRRYWETLIGSGRFGHAHILSGHSGVGKDALAFFIAAALNCKADTKKPCGNCISCRQFLNLENQALQLIFA
ncbi:MAG: hypothetical protein L3J79_05910, partial [Candidatus Marinimicrobia bacterium]|nr:hypothetical protein [Candidatus Neomarinimicrobiota bacterium]